ncbi:MAG: tetratricopeptide repeat protein [Pseudomonadales bacterium]|nr:tetratricopeptide repeat protein [Pseudomonadales bacterium]
MARNKSAKTNQRFIAPVNICAAFALLLQACSVPQQRDGQVVEEVDLSAPQPGAISMPVRQIEGAGASAVDQLLQQANAAIEQQRYGQAEALIERAMRVSPYDARAYFALAQVNFHQQRLALSESLLQKARALAVNDTPLLRSIDAFSARLVRMR